MRLAVAALSCAAFLVGSLTMVSAQDGTPFDQAGFHLALPSGWVENTKLEQIVVQGFHKGDPGDPVQAFAWANPQSTAYLLVQVTSSAGQIPAGHFRSNLQAMHEAIPKGMGAPDVHPTITDDGMVMTGTFEIASEKTDTLSVSKALIDSGRHLRGFSVMCMMVAPVSDDGRQACNTILSSFAITLDRSTFLPLESK